MRPEKPLFGGIDAGGTEFKCIVASDPENIVAEAKILVGEPQQTLAECVAFFRKIQSQTGSLRQLGVGCFGPLELNRDSPSYGQITATPKPHWQNVQIVQYFNEALGVPVAFETDVNAALIGELRWGVAAGLHSAVYVTIGTGIGAGVMMNNRLVHGGMHPEAGHMLISRHRDDQFQGVCPFHGACLEGMASGPALAERWQRDPEKLSDDHPAWSLEAHYLGSMCVNLALFYSPQRIILGGGVMRRAGLYASIRKSYLSQINAYLGAQDTEIDRFIVAPQLADRAGALGAVALAQVDALQP